VQLAAALGAERVDQALGLTAVAGRFDEDDLPSILDHLATTAPGHFGGRSERGYRPPLRNHWGKSLAHPGELSAWPVQEKSRGNDYDLGGSQYRRPGHE
jgi:hypothetical protein